MNKALALIILFVGVGLAAASGARNGDALTDYRANRWLIAQYSAAVELEGDERATAEASLREKGLLDPARSLAVQVNEANGLLPAKTAELVTALRAAGLISRDPTFEQSVAEATMRKEDLLALATNVEELQAAEEAAANPDGADAPVEPIFEDEALAEEWELLAQATGEGALVAPAIDSLRERGVVHGLAGEKEVREVLDTPKAQERAVNGLIKAGLLPSPDTVEDRLEAAKSQAPLPSADTRVSQWWTSAGAGWGGGVFLIVVGAMMARRQQQAELSGKGASAAGQVDFKANVTAILAQVDALAETLKDLPMDDDAPAARATIDTIHLELIDPVVEQRGRFMAKHGIGSFAEYFSPFSAGERHLNRTWSALTDGHAPTARDAVARARTAFAQAHRSFMKADAKKK